MVLIATPANVLHCQIMIVYSPVLKDWIFCLQMNLFLPSLLIFLPQDYWLSALCFFLFDKEKMSDDMFDWYKRSQPAQVESIY